MRGVVKVKMGGNWGAKEAYQLWEEGWGSNLQRSAVEHQNTKKIIKNSFMNHQWLSNHYGLAFVYNVQKGGSKSWVQLFTDLKKYTMFGFIYCVPVSFGDEAGSILFSARSTILFSARSAILFSARSTARLLILLASRDSTLPSPRESRLLKTAPGRSPGISSSENL